MEEVPDMGNKTLFLVEYSLDDEVLTPQASMRNKLFNVLVTLHSRTRV